MHLGIFGLTGGEYTVEGSKVSGASSGILDGELLLSLSGEGCAEEGGEDL